MLETLEQNPLPVAYQGGPGSYSEEAARGHFGVEVDTLPCGTFEETFDAVLTGKAAYATVPIENSTAGSVESPHDLLEIHHEEIQIIGEFYQPVRINAYRIKLQDSKNNETQLKPTEVRAHPKLLEQAKYWINDQQLKPKPAWDSAGALMDLAKSKRNIQSLEKTVILAPERAEQIVHTLYERGKTQHDIEKIATDVQDEATNTTRFAIIGKNQETNEANKASFIITLPHIPAALFVSLAPFALQRIQLTRLIARPVPDNPFAYKFYLDAEVNHDQLKSVTDQLRQITPNYRVLGHYPKGIRPNGFPAYNSNEPVISQDTVVQILSQYLEQLKTQK